MDARILNDHRDTIAIGASAGGVGALQSLMGPLPPDLPASVLVTLHMSPNFTSSLDEILSRAGPLPVRFAQDDEPVERGIVYLAPPTAIS